jgi:hypothetical protein
LQDAEKGQFWIIRRRPLDQNSSKHEKIILQTRGPMFAPKFGKFVMDRKELAYDVKNKKVS